MASFEAEMEVPYMSDFKITGKGPTLKKNPSLKWWIDHFMNGNIVFPRDDTT